MLLFRGDQQSSMNSRIQHPRVLTANIRHIQAWLVSSRVTHTVTSNCPVFDSSIRKVQTLSALNSQKKKQRF
ncbi:hypothetical protein XELAEV_18046762mg [Xenopus laevis]|uniref:Uncharacterized protein n=1 Tax=Xenopus laevis TaxID=8355 RepID=A0A974BU84_XENLA|nr:hypothetical protein XELAEV_18046762mg [Xenopus laevis]